MDLADHSFGHAVLDTSIFTNTTSRIPTSVTRSEGPKSNLRAIDDLARSLWRGRVTVAACSIVVGIATYVCTYQLPRQYTAEGLVAVDTQRLAVPELQGVLSGESTLDLQPQVHSEVLLLRSPALLRTITEEMNLAADPEFNPFLRPPSLVGIAATRSREAVHDVIAVVPASITKQLAYWGIVLPPRKQAEPPSPSAVREAVVTALSENLAVSNDNRSLVISVGFTAEDPQRAADIVNSLVARYLANKSDARTAANAGAQLALQGRLANARAELETAERQVQEARTRHQLVAIRAGSVGQQQLEEMTSALARASAERAQIEANAERAQAMAHTGTIPLDLADVLSSATIARLRDRESEALRHVTEVSDRLGRSHPERRIAEAGLAAVRDDIVNEARRIVSALHMQSQTAREREIELGRQLEQARQDATLSSGLQADLSRLEKDADARRGIYLNLMQRVEQTAVETRDPKILGARLVSPAISPPNPSAPRPGFAGGVGALGGICLGALFTLGRGRRREGFRDLEDLAQETRLPALASVPRGPPWGGMASLQARIASFPRGPEAEALRGLRTRLRFASTCAAPRSVAFVASVPGEGASTLAAAFARVAALDGLRVLLMEGDLQHPSLAVTLGVPQSDGLPAALSRSLPWPDLVSTDVVTPLHLLLAAKPEVNAHQMLESVPFQHLMADVCEEYNLVVLDAPSVLLSAESMLLAHRVDATLLVVEANVTPRNQVKLAAERLIASGGGLTATVLNRVAAPRGHAERGCF